MPALGLRPDLLDRHLVGVEHPQVAQRDVAVTPEGAPRHDVPDVTGAPGAEERRQEAREGECRRP